MSIIPLPANVRRHHPPLLSTISPSQNQDPAVTKKREKRRREEADHATEVDGKVKKKKKKKRHADHRGVDEEIAVESPSVQLADTELARKKKKDNKKKNKGKERELEIDPALVDNSSVTALISAIVAAAAGTTDAPAPAEDMQPPPPPPAPDMMPQFHPNIIPPPLQQHFMPYPFMSYEYPPSFMPPGMPPNMMPPQTLFPASASFPFSELTFGSNEDVLRALQSLDMSKITNVLKTVGEAATDGDTPGGPTAAHVGQLPVASAAILRLTTEAAPVATAAHRRTLDMTVAGTGTTSPEHAHLLANKWMNAGKLAELVESEGLVYKKGKFSAIEEQQLKAAIENYRVMKGLTEEHILSLVYPNSDKARDNAFWSEITAAVPQRPIIAVYHHVRRTHHPMRKRGNWNPDEDAALKQAVTDLGQQWEKVSLRVGRMSSDCRDRYRNHIVNRDIRVTGVWSKAEEEQLTRIVTDMTVKQGKDTDNDVFWGQVSDLMGGKRSRQQCRIKWTDALNKTVKNEGLKPRWNQQDGYILVHKVDSLNVRDDTEIDWKLIPDAQWNLWSAHTLQRRWLTMKRGIKGHEDMTHAEIMDILRVKKPPPPPPVTRKRKERKVTSAESIEEDVLVPMTSPVEGSSTQQGTFAGTQSASEEGSDSSSDSSSSEDSD